MIRLVFEGNWILRRGSAHPDGDTYAVALTSGRTRGMVYISPEWVRGWMNPNGSIERAISDGTELTVSGGYIMVPHVDSSGYIEEVEWYSQKPVREQCECGRDDCFTDRAPFSMNLSQASNVSFGRFPVNGVRSDSLFDNSTLPEFVVRIIQG